MTNGNYYNNQSPSNFPWSQKRLNFTTAQGNPFPRYGAAVNSVASKDGDIYMMGGLIDGVTVGDIWKIESSSLSCAPVTTFAEGPGPRVGHASLLVGNAFIVFGGDTKTDGNDMLDEKLYLLNICMSFFLHTSAVVYILTSFISFPAMVACAPSRPSPGRALRSHVEYSRIEALCFWRTGGGLVFQ